jgi:hypothetical protein
MKLNCKQGDLAVIVRSCCGNEGKIVRCVELDLTGQILSPTLEILNEPAWVTDPPVRGWIGGIAPVHDALLRPIRDGDGQDEMLRLVGLPADKTIA